MPRLPVTGDQALVRKLNTSLILDTLRLHAPLSRANLAARTGLNRSTVSSIVTELLERGLVRETELHSAGIGRPGMSLELNPGGGCAVGIEIGVDFISILLSDFVAGVLWRRRVVSRAEDGEATIIARAEALIDEALVAGGAQGLHPLGIGVGLPGMVDVHNGALKFAPNLGWRDVSIGRRWAGRFSAPVFVENEANAAALGEYFFGVARAVRNLIYLSAGVGLGGGILLNGKLFRGSGGYAGEIGHMTVDPGGDLCGCGKRGCWETLVGPRAIVRRVRAALDSAPASLIRELAAGDLERLTVGVVVQAAEAGDPLALAALRDTGEYLGVGIANLINVFNPEMVVLGGALNLASDVLLPVVEKTVEAHALDGPRQGVQILPSAHGADACVMGAVALVLDDILREPFSSLA
ncbi:MAG: ROK family transcriptional regulator [Anaerolineae bacterium]|nr:ROK family transcriptional regulator [Anaerolineae bacterium]